MGKMIYLDNAATTKTAPELFHNRNSIPHSKTGCNPKGRLQSFFQQMRCFALFFAAFFVKMVLAAFLTVGVSCYI